MQVEKDVIYDEAHDLPVDIYVPDAANGGAVIYAHGGGWFRGDKENEAIWANILRTPAIWWLFPIFG